MFFLIDFSFFIGVLVGLGISVYCESFIDWLRSKLTNKCVHK